jgi:hypothetical protein
MVKLKVGSTYLFPKHKTIIKLLELTLNQAIFNGPINTGDISIDKGYPYFPHTPLNASPIEITDSNRELVNILYS